MLSRLSPACVALLFFVGPASAADAETEKKALAVLDASCSFCHAKGKNKANFGYVLDPAKMIKEGKIVPKKPDDSPVYVRMCVDQDMPPEEAPQSVKRPTEADRKTVKDWIEKMEPAAPPTTEVKTPVGITRVDMLKLIHKDLSELRDPDTDAKYTRYFTLENLRNNPQFTDGDLRKVRAALAKLINSLSNEKEIVIPREVGTGGVLYAIDLRDLDWDDHPMWNLVMKAYPHGISLEDSDDFKTATMARQVKRWTGVDIPAVRADWFIVNAARPPLYHGLLYQTLLNLPGDSLAGAGKPRPAHVMNARDLEAYLRVNVNENFRRDRLARAGYSKSGVSEQNRTIERHKTAFGAYWKSYDFKKRDPNVKGRAPRDRLLLFPLGPKFPENEYEDMAFDHDGGEIIFHLPNGLQAYLLVNDKDERIDEGPTDVVNDENKISGGVAIVNGLSCMNCHVKGSKAGDNPALDYVRKAHRVQIPEAARKVEKLYPTADAMKKLLADDREVFLKAADQATKPFLTKDDGATEPIGFVSVLMNRNDLTPEMAAYELGFTDPKEFLAVLKTDDRLWALGLKPLGMGLDIKRTVWEGKAANNRFISTQQAVMQTLNLGSARTFK